MHTLKTAGYMKTENKTKLMNKLKQTNKNMPLLHSKAILARVSVNGGNVLLFQLRGI